MQVQFNKYLYMDELEKLSPSLLTEISRRLSGKKISTKEDVYPVISEVLQEAINKNFKGAGFRKNYTFTNSGNKLGYYDHDVFGKGDQGEVDMDKYIPHMYNEFFNRPKEVDHDAVKKAKYPNIYRMDELAKQGDAKYRDSLKKEETRNYDLTDRVKLTSGKFRGVNVPRGVLQEIAEQADAAGLDRKTAFGLIGQESTFGEGINPDGKTKRKDWGGEESYNPVALSSYWAVSHGRPNAINMHDFISRQGMRVEKDNEKSSIHTLYHKIPETEQDSINIESRLAANPRIIQKFEENINDPKNYELGNLYKKAFEYYKTGKYNAKSPTHTAEVNNSANIAASDPAIKPYLK